MYRNASVEKRIALSHLSVILVIFAGLPIFVFENIFSERLKTIEGMGVLRTIAIRTYTHSRIVKIFTLV